MGEVLLLPVARAAAWPGDLARCCASRAFETWALTPDPSAEPIWSLAVPDRVAVLLGAEGPGLSAGRAGRRRPPGADPDPPGVDSLNVGHAAAVAFAAVGRPGPMILRS